MYVDAERAGVLNSVCSIHTFSTVVQMLLMVFLIQHLGCVCSKNINIYKNIKRKGSMLSPFTGSKTPALWKVWLMKKDKKVAPAVQPIILILIWSSCLSFLDKLISFCLWKERNFRRHVFKKNRYFSNVAEILVGIINGPEVHTFLGVFWHCGIVGKIMPTWRYSDVAKQCGRSMIVMSQYLRQLKKGQCHEIF